MKSITTIMKGDESGELVNINAYDAYGIANETNIGRFQYTGQIAIPELGLYHYKARVYSPTLGRFLQTDPIGYEDQVNLYAYVGNDPVNLIDPTGLSCEDTGGTPSEGETDRGGVIIPGTYCDPENPEDDGPPIVVTPRSREPNSATFAPLLQSAQCPSNVSIKATLLVLPMQGITGASLEGTLTDLSTGEVQNFSASGVAIGLGGGSFNISGTLPGFNSLDQKFAFSFLSGGASVTIVDFSKSGGRFTRGDLSAKGQFGEVSVGGDGIHSPINAFTIGFRDGAYREDGPC